MQIHVAKYDLALTTRLFAIALCACLSIHTPLAKAETALQKLQNSLGKLQNQAKVNNGRQDISGEIDSAFVNMLPDDSSLPAVLSASPNNYAPIGSLGALATFKNVVELPDGTTFIGASGRILLATNRGREWTVIGSNLQEMTGFTALPDRKLFYSTLGGVLRSDDMGRTWKKLGGINVGGWGMATDSKGSVYVYGNPGLHQSDDGGITWREVNPQTNGNVKDVSGLYADSNGDIYAALHYGIFLRRAGENSWARISSTVNGHTIVAGNRGRVCTFGTLEGEGWTNSLITDSGRNTTKWGNAGTQAPATRSCAIDSSGYVYTAPKFSPRLDVTYKSNDKKIIIARIPGEFSAFAITQSDMMYLIDGTGKLAAVDLDAGRKRSNEIRRELEASGFEIAGGFAASDHWLRNTYLVRQSSQGLPTRYVVSSSGRWFQRDEDPALYPHGRDPNDKLAIHKSIVAAFPRDRMIAMPGKGKPMIIVKSAWDCPYCRLLESWLKQEGMAYYVIPMALSENNGVVSEWAWCAPDRAKAWSSALATKGKIAKTQCQGYGQLYTDFVLDNPLSYGKPATPTPLIYFADGSTMSGFDLQKQNDFKVRVMRAGSVD